MNQKQIGIFLKKCRENKKLTIAERLRNGEKVICAKCKKGYYVTDAKDISTSHGFYCNRCNLW